MPYSRPTVTQLRAQAAADITASLPGADGLLRFSNLGVAAIVMAELVNGLYGYCDWIAKQSNPYTAEDEHLEAWAALKNIFRQDASPAGGTVSFPASAGADNVQADTPVIRSDGYEYVTVGVTVPAGGAALVTVIAAPGSEGSAGNCPSGTQFTLGVGLSGVSSAGAATANLTGGADLQSNASLRAEMLQAYQAPPQGGAQADYFTWALAVPGVTRVWVVGSHKGAAGQSGAVTVYFMMDQSDAAYGGFPQGSDGVATGEPRDGAATGDQLEVANAIYPKRPVTALVYAYAPEANTVAFTIGGISGASADTQAGIQAAIAQVFLAQAAVGGATIPDGSAYPPVQLSAIESAVAAVAGSAGFVITVVTCTHGAVSEGATGNITSNAGYLAVPGAITYVA